VLHIGAEDSTFIVEVATLERRRARQPFDHAFQRQPGHIWEAALGSVGSGDPFETIMLGVNDNLGIGWRASLVVGPLGGPTVGEQKHQLETSLFAQFAAGALRDRFSRET
jgi:hypothetical protein